MPSPADKTHEIPEHLPARPHTRLMDDAGGDGRLASDR